MSDYSYDIAQLGRSLCMITTCIDIYLTDLHV